MLSLYGSAEGMNSGDFCLFEGSQVYTVPSCVLDRRYEDHPACVQQIHSQTTEARHNPYFRCPLPLSYLKPKPPRPATSSRQNTQMLLVKASLAAPPESPTAKMPEHRSLIKHVLPVCVDLDPQNYNELMNRFTTARPHRKRQWALNTYWVDKRDKGLRRVIPPTPVSL